MTDLQHNKYIAYTFLGYGIFQLFMLFLIMAMFFFMFSIPGRPGSPEPPIEFMAMIFSIAFLFQMFFTVPSFIASYGLLKKRKWARVASIVAGVLASMSVPVGTAACVYSLWFFMGDNWKSVYGVDREAARQPMQQMTGGQAAVWDGYQMDENGEVVYRPVEPPDWR